MAGLFDAITVEKEDEACHDEELEEQEQDKSLIKCAGFCWPPMRKIGFQQFVVWI